MQITVSNLEALSMFVLRVHGKKTANGAGYTGPIRKMTSPAMTAAVLRTKSGALSPLQHVLQVQKAKISALRSVVKRLQDGRPTEHHTSPTKSDHSVRVNFLSKRVENELSSPASDEESSLQHQCRLKSPSQTRSILPSVRQAQELAERQSHLKNQYNWRRLADIQVIQATAEPASTTTGGGHAYYPSGGNPPASLARAWSGAHAEQKAWEKGWHAGPQTLYPSQQQQAATSDSQRFPVAPSTTIRATLQLNWTSVGGDGSAQRIAFRNVLQQDLANASGLPPSSFVIQQLFPGSVIVVCDIQADPSHRGPDPESAAIDLLQQAGNPISVLRSGSLTRFITDFAISGNSSPLNHNTDFAARLVYSQRSDVHGANRMPERASLTMSSPPAPPGSIISIRPLGKTFGSELRDFEGTLHLEIGTSHPVRSLYYTLNGSDPTPDYYVGYG